MNRLDKNYQELLKEILETGYQKGDRTGTGTKSIFGTQLRHNMKEGFPLLTTKKIYWKGIVHELLWFLKGDTNIKYLVDNNVNIWNGDAYKKYLRKVNLSSNPNDYTIQGENGTVDWIRPCTQEEFIQKIKNNDTFCENWGDLGPIYGKQWRDWNVYKPKFGTSKITWENDQPIDQIANIIETLKTNPDDRRMLVSAWNVAEINEMTLPPCHYSFQVYTRELTIEERNRLWWGYIHDDTVFYKKSHSFYDENKIPKRAISLKFIMRSIDTMLGLPFNIASYGLLLSMIAKVVNMIPEDLIFSGGDTHLYSNHIEQANEQMTREPFELPTISFKKDHYESINDFTFEDIILNNYKSHESIKAELSN